MKQTIHLFLHLALLSIACVNAAELPADYGTRVRQLYTCHYFYDAGSKAQDKALQKKSQDLSNAFLLKASILAVDSGGEAKANKLAALARTEFNSLMKSWGGIQDDSERGRRLEEFNSSCEAALNAKIDRQSSSEPEEKSKYRRAAAVRLFGCADYFMAKSTVAEAEDKDRQIALSKDYLLKAEAFSVKLDNGASKETLIVEGKAVANRWISDVGQSPDGVQKTPLANKINRLCSTAGRADRE